jgi:hypothetical protein
MKWNGMEWNGMEWNGMESWNNGIMECIIISTIFIRIIIIDERQTCSRSRYYSSITVCHF